MNKGQFMKHNRTGQTSTTKIKTIYFSCTMAFFLSYFTQGFPEMPVSSYNDKTYKQEEMKKPAIIIERKHAAGITNSPWKNKDHPQSDEHDWHP